jgi:hypothetical protein
MAVPLGWETNLEHPYFLVRRSGFLLRRMRGLKSGSEVLPIFHRHNWSGIVRGERGSRESIAGELSNHVIL